MNTRTFAQRTSMGLLTLMALGITIGSVQAQAPGDQPGGDRPPVGAGRGDNPLPPRRRPEGFPVIPPHEVDALNLSDKQRQDLMSLEKEVQEKLKKILTPEQAKKLQKLRDMHRPPMGRNGMRPPPPGGQGGRFDGPDGHRPPPPPRDGGRPGGRDGRPGGPPPPPRDGQDAPPPPRDGGPGDREGGAPPPPPPHDNDQASSSHGSPKKA